MRIASILENTTEVSAIQCIARNTVSMQAWWVTSPAWSVLFVVAKTTHDVLAPGALSPKACAQ